MALTRTKSAVIGLAGLTLVGGALAGCSASNNSVTAQNPTLSVSQDGITNDSSVYNPFYVIGSNYAASSTVTVGIYAMGTKTNPIYTQDATSSATGTLSTLIPGEKIAAGDYTAIATVKGTQVATQNFTDQGSRNGALTHVAGAGVPGQFVSPMVVGNNLYVAQSTNGGAIYRWQVNDLPKSPSATPVAVAPTDNWKPSIPANVKMEQIVLDTAKNNIFISKKAMNGSATGGNSVWSYPWSGTSGSGDGTNLAGLPTYGGDGSQAWPGNTAQAAQAYTYAPEHFPKPDGTKNPTGSAIGNGGGVTQIAKSGTNYLYFGSLQSGCVYKQNMTSKQTWAIYCIPSWGANNQNQSIYSLDSDTKGNVYAMYQGSTDNNTIILKIAAGGDGQSSDTIQAAQLTGFARSVGLTVNADGTRIFANGVSMKQYDSQNTNTILEVNSPTWGTPEKPAALTPIATVIPGAYNETWLTGMTLVDKKSNKGDRLYIADNVGGFWIFYL